MMVRPEFVGEAIEFDTNDQVMGRYGDYILKPVYQPIYTVGKNSTATLTGFEGLIRPYLNDFIVQPEDFFKLVNKEDALFVECLCLALHIRGYKQATLNGGGLFVNVNVETYQSIDEIEREFFYTFSQLSKYGLNRETIVFEILETKITNPEILAHLCKLIHNNGYKFALDDFGTDHSNVERYIAVHPDIIKLDRSLFVTAMQTLETSKLLKSLINAFQENGVSVLMEGLETEEEMFFAADMNVDMLQGFYLGIPEAIAVAFPKDVILPERGRVNLVKSSA